MDAAYLKSILSYDAELGHFTWLQTRGRGGRGAVAGARAGAGNRTSSYIIIKIDQIQYTAQQLAWLYMTGQMPTHDIDHRNRQRDDNRWINLREATRQQNCANRGANRNNTTGARGVTFRRGRFEVRLGQNWRRLYIGAYRTLQEATAASEAATLTHNGAFACRGGVSSAT